MKKAEFPHSAESKFTHSIFRDFDHRFAKKCIHGEKACCSVSNYRVKDSDIEYVLKSEVESLLREARAEVWDKVLETLEGETYLRYDLREKIQALRAKAATEREGK